MSDSELPAQLNFRPQAAAAPFWLEVTGSLLVMVAIGITSLPAATASLATAPLPAEASAWANLVIDTKT